MGNFQSRLDYFKENDIDPYQIVGVSKDCSKLDLQKAFKKKARRLHPDKTNNTTAIEFKLLKECYDFINEYIEINITKNHTELKKQYKNHQQEDHTSSRDFYKTEWNDMSTRNTLFVNNDLEFDRWGDIVEQKSKGPTSYDNVEKKNYKNIFSGGNFNNSTFNAAFELQHNTQEKIMEGQESFSPMTVDAYSSLCPLEIETYNGLIVEKRKQIKPVSFQEPYFEPELVCNLPTKKMNKITRDNTKGSSSISKKKMGGMVENYITNRKEIQVDTSRSYAENEALIYENRINSMREEMNRSKNSIMENLHIYPQHTIAQFRQGQLEDSSTCIRDDQLTIPKGIRYK